VLFRGNPWPHREGLSMSVTFRGWQPFTKLT
jgi:hypothetical protein